MTKATLIAAILMLAAPLAFAGYSGNWVGAPADKSVCDPERSVNDYRRYDCDISANRNPGGHDEEEDEDKR